MQIINDVQWNRHASYGCGDAANDKLNSKYYGLVKVEHNYLFASGCLHQPCFSFFIAQKVKSRIYTHIFIYSDPTM